MAPTGIPQLADADALLAALPRREGVAPGARPERERSRPRAGGRRGCGRRLHRGDRAFTEKNVNDGRRVARRVRAGACAGREPGGGDARTCRPRSDAPTRGLSAAAAADVAQRLLVPRRRRISSATRSASACRPSGGSWTRPGRASVSAGRPSTSTTRAAWPRPMWRRVLPRRPAFDATRAGRRVSVRARCGRQPRDRGPRVLARRSGSRTASTSSVLARPGSSRTNSASPSAPRSARPAAGTIGQVAQRDAKRRLAP